MIAVNLRTEYLKDPLGTDLQNPRLFWNCEGGKDRRPTAFSRRRKGKRSGTAERYPRNGCGPPIQRRFPPASGWRRTPRGSGRSKPFLRRVCSLRATGRQSGSAAITASTGKSAIPQTVSARSFPSPTCAGRACTSPPAGCMRCISTAGVLGISCSLRGIPITQSASSTRRTTSLR